MKRIILAIVVVFSACAVASPAFASEHHSAAFGKKASAKVAPFTHCAWGPAEAPYPADWQILKCGSAPVPFAVGNADLSEVQDLKPVVYVDAIDGKQAILGVEVSNKEYFYTVELSKLPKGAKVESWYSADPALVKMLRSLEKSGALPIMHNGANEDVAANDGSDK